MEKHLLAFATEEPALPPGESPAGAGSGDDLATSSAGQARQYRRQRVRLYLIEQLIDLLYLAALSVLFAWWLDWPAELGFWARTLQVGQATATVLLGNWLLTLPLVWWRGFVLEHRYGLSRMRLRTWMWRQLKIAVLGLVFSTAVFTGLFWCVWWAGPWWLLLAAAAFLGVSVVLGQVVPVAILPLFYRVERLEEAELLRRFEPLAQAAGLRLEGIYRLELSRETVKANAALTGLGRTRRVLLSDTLLEHFGPEELEVIVAHELGHHVHRHLLKLMLLSTAGALVGFWLCDQVVFGLWPGLPGGAYAQAGPQHVPVLLLAVNVLGLLGQPLGNALSRHFERQADRYALEQTGAAGAFIRAMEELARLNKTDPDPPRLEVWWLHSHPPVRERIAMAARFASGAAYAARAESPEEA